MEFSSWCESSDAIYFYFYHNKKEGNEEGRDGWTGGSQNQKESGFEKENILWKDTHYTKKDHHLNRNHLPSDSSESLDHKSSSPLVCKFRVHTNYKVQIKILRCISNEIDYCNRYWMAV